MANDTVIGQMVLTPTINAIGCVFSYSGDDNANNQVTFQSREAGQGEWRVWELTAVNRAARQRLTSLFPVKADTSYEVRVVVEDPDGGSGTLVGIITTMSDTLPSMDTGRSLYASPTGVGDGSSPAAPARFSSLLATLQPGDTVYCLEGDYYGLNHITRSGQPDRWLTITAYGDGPVRFRASDPVIAAGVAWMPVGAGVYSIPNTASVWYVAQGDSWLYPYMSLVDLQAPKWPQIPGGWFWDGTTLYIRTVDNSDPSGQPIHVVRGAATPRLFAVTGSHVRFTGIEISHSLRGIVLFNSNDIIVDHCVIHSCFDGLHVGKLATASRVRIEDNEFYNTISPDWPWGALSGTEPSPKLADRRCHAIAFNQPAGVQIIIRRNRIRNWWDGIGYSAWGALDNPALAKDFDIYENEVKDCLDDPVETEGSLTNSRVWSNLFVNGLTGFAPSPCRVGPHYVFWNRMVQFRQAMFKLGPASNGVVFIAHNTGYSDKALSNGITNYGGAGVSNHHFFNNIIRVGRYVIELGAAYPVTLDYNLYFTTDPARFIKFGVLYPSLMAFRAATGQEAHGVQADPRLASPETGDVTPVSGSPAIDAGLHLPGVNDSYLGAAPDMGVVETGGPPSPPLVSIIATPDVGYPPLPVSLQAVNTGGPITAYLWESGDGQTSTAPSPSFTYLTPGTYTARLTATGPGGPSTAEMTITVLATPLAAFTPTPREGPAPLTVQFIDQSIGAEAWGWDFGDGSPLDGRQHPRHIYTASGSYIVTLTVSGPGGSDTESKGITVTEPLPPSVPVGKILAVASLFAILVAMLSRRR